jgi:hypothetical protein
MHTTGNTQHLQRSSLWSNEIKDILTDELMGMKYVKMLNDLASDVGSTVNIPSIGQSEVSNYVENTPITYSSLDTGNFQFTITDYIADGKFITVKAMQDLYYAQELVSRFVPEQTRAIMTRIETDLLKLMPEGQTSANTNAINGAEHRWIGSGTNETLAVVDFAKVRYGMQKANIPMTNLIAIVDPSAEYTLSTLSNLVNVSNNPQWEGIVRDGISTGMQFRMNIFGFDIYVSNYLKTSVNETIGAKTSAAGVANLFFSADSLATPFVGAWGQMPKVDSEFNKDMQREEYVVTARYGLKLYRPENAFVVITDTDQVS